MQLLEAALAHHNLASYDEAIKFLAAARAALVESTRAALLAERRKQALAAANKAEAAAAALRTAAEFGSSQLSPSASSSVDASLAPAAGATVDVSSSAVVLDASAINAMTISDEEVHVNFDLDMYITVCSGNVYQSSGDDEQALHRYMSGWNRARGLDPDSEWSMVFLNSIGAIAYYTLRYELGFHCFSTVAAYRTKVSSSALMISCII